MSNDTSLANEQWRDIPGYEGLYQVSDHGRVKTVKRVIIRSNGYKQTIKERIRKLSLHPAGRFTVRIRNNDGGKSFWVHRLVLEAFVGPCPPGMECCHNDGNPKNNHVSNLRWDTRSANQLDRNLHGTMHQRSRTHCPYGHLLKAPNLVPAQMKKGKRTCLACNRARGYVRFNPHLKPHYQEVSDSYYGAILAP